MYFWKLAFLLSHETSTKIRINAMISFVRCQVRHRLRPDISIGRLQRQGRRQMNVDQIQTSRFPCLVMCYDLWVCKLQNLDTNSKHTVLFSLLLRFPVKSMEWNKQTHEQKPGGCISEQHNFLLHSDSNLSWHRFSNLHLSGGKGGLCWAHLLFLRLHPPSHSHLGAVVISFYGQNGIALSFWYSLMVSYLWVVWNFNV